MIYNTGTLSVSGNTATGTGTNWTAAASQVRAGQTLIVLSNPVQMFQIAAVNSATSLAVTPAASPDLSGQKYGILISDALSVDGLAQAMSQLINEYDENISGWEAFASTAANQNISVTINGVSMQIPALGKLVQKGAGGVISVNDGGTGANNALNARKNIGAAAAGDNTDITSLWLTSFRLASNILFTSDLVEVGGSAYLDLQPRNSNWVKLRIIGGYNTRRGINGVFGSSSFNFDWGGPTAVGANPFELWVDGSRIGQVAFTTSSDKYLKKDIEYQDDNAAALEEVMQYRAASFKYRARGILEESDTQYGFIAQDLVEVSPDVVRGKGLENYDYDPDNPGAGYSLDQMAIIMKLTQAIQHQQKQIQELQEVTKNYSSGS
ncbi:Chaperone of endosialidase [Enterobacter sp. kpr-6]|uniref:tail fiber domain-containing protein n=1 Tax=Enterobacter sp. kpr-6 TaxID=1761782 RepID=UPI0008E7B948|nr:tail fiber domain-containing protein [Enterobacter sp. kpr-6]SFR01073.1 Chaperone of endosialidase [Enterobacter sp. kpr-6]